MTDYFDPSRSFERIADTQKGILEALNVLSQVTYRPQERIAQILARCGPPWNMPMIPLAMDVMASFDRVYDASLVVQV